MIRETFLQYFILLLEQILFLETSKRFFVSEQTQIVIMIDVFMTIRE